MTCFPKNYYDDVFQLWKYSVGDIWTTLFDNQIREANIPNILDFTNLFWYSDVGDSWPNFEMYSGKLIC